jgi:ribosome-associated protein
MDIRKLQRAIVDGLEDVKGRDIVVFNTEALSPLFERVIIATGASNRQTKALAASVRDAVKGRGMQVLATEGEGSGEWVIVDCGAAVAHIMQADIRDYYRLEELWGGKKVSMKLGEADRPAVAQSATAARKAAAPATPKSTKPTKPTKPASAPRAGAKRRAPAAPAAPAKRAVAGKAAIGARKPAARPASPAAKPAGKRAPRPAAKKSAPARKAPPRSRA